MSKANKLKVCVVYNGAPHYRAGIFKLMDEEYDCEWFLGQGYLGIKQIPLTAFKNAHLLEVVYLKGALCWQKGEIAKFLSCKYDVIVALGHIPQISTWIALFLHKFFNKDTKVYLWSHGVLRKRSRLRSLFDKIFFSLPFATFTYGDLARKNIISLGIPESRVYAIHNSLDYDKQLQNRARLKKDGVYDEHFSNSLPVVIFIGRLIKDKQLGMILSANAELHKTGKGFNVVFIGDGEDKKDLLFQTKELNLENHVWFYGACYDETLLSSLIYNADLCVSPGPIGLTAMHSMVYGCPVITNDNFGLHGPEFEAIVAGETGDFFKECSVEDLARCISRWFQNAPERKCIREKCYEIIDKEWNPEFQINVLRKYLKK